MFGSKKKKPDRDEYVRPLLFEPDRFPANLPPPENPQLFVHRDFPGAQLFQDPEFPGKTFLFEGEKKVKKVKKPERDEHPPLLFEPEPFPAHLPPPENPLVFVHRDFPGIRLFRDPGFPGNTFIFEEKKQEKEPEDDEHLQPLLVEPEDYPVDIPPPNKVRVFVHEDFPRAVLFRSPEFPGKTFYYARSAYVETRKPWYGGAVREDKTALPEARESETTLPEALHVTQFQIPSSPESQGDCDEDSDIVACKAALHASTKFVKASVGEAHTTDVLTDSKSTPPTKLGCDEDTGAASRQSINVKTKGVKNTAGNSYVTETQSTSARAPELVVDDSEETTPGKNDHASSKGRFRKMFENFYLGKAETASLRRPIEASEEGPRVGTGDKVEASSDDRVQETVENFYLTDFQTTSLRSPVPVVADSKATTSWQVAQASSKERFRELAENFYLDSNTGSPHKPTAESEEGPHVDTIESAKKSSESCVKETVENFYLTDFQSGASQPPEVTRSKHHRPALEGPAEDAAELRSNEAVEDFCLPESWTPEFSRIPIEPQPSADAQPDQPTEDTTEKVKVVEESPDNSTENASSGATFEETIGEGDHLPDQSIEKTTQEVTDVEEGSDNNTENASSGVTAAESIDEGAHHPNQSIEDATQEVTGVEVGSVDDAEDTSSGTTTTETINEGHHNESGNDEVQNANDREIASDNRTDNTTVPTEDETSQEQKVPGRRNFKALFKSIFGVEDVPDKAQHAPAQDRPSQDQHIVQGPMSAQTDAAVPTTPLDVGPETSEVDEKAVPPQQQFDDNDDLAERYEIYANLEAYRVEQLRKSQEEFGARVESHGLEDIAGLSVKDSKTRGPGSIVTDPEPIMADPEPIIAGPEPIDADPMVGLEFEVMPDQTVIVTSSSTNELIHPKSCTPCIRGDPWTPRMPNRVFGHDIPDCETFCQGLIGVIIVFYFFRPDKLPAFIRHTFGRFVSPYNRHMWSWLRLLAGIVTFIRIASFGLPDGLFEIVCEYPDEPDDHWPQIWYVPKHAIPFFAPKNGDMTPERRW